MGKMKAYYCLECDGDGWDVISCCGVSIKDNIGETDICPCCGEHCGDESVDCQECQGTGKQL